MPFRTRSDTEVVLRAYAEWGEDVADHLDGMFAFAVWDERAQRLLLVRDRLGVKPLFWAAVDGGLAFASEPKALFAHPEIRPRVDADGLREAYSLLFNTGPTVWSGVREVEPGGLLVLDRKGIRERRYWQLEAVRPQRRPGNDRGADPRAWSARPPAVSWRPTSRCAACCPAASTPPS